MAGIGAGGWGAILAGAGAECPAFALTNFCVFHNSVGCTEFTFAAIFLKDVNKG